MFENIYILKIIFKIRYCENYFIYSIFQLVIHLHFIIMTYEIPRFKFPELQEQQISDLKKRFDSLDKDHNGKLDKNEITQAMQAEKLPLDYVDMIFALADKNHDKVIDFEEFQDALKLVGNAYVDSKNAVVQLFARLDTDHNGLLDEDEIFNYLTMISRGKATREEAKAVITKNDKDHDGKISLNEFLQGAKFI